MAGVITWASIFPLDVIKTRYQVQDMTLASPEQRPLLAGEVVGRTEVVGTSTLRRQSALQVARDAYCQEGIAVFFRGLGVCSARAFIVNAVQVSVSIGRYCVIRGLTSDSGWFTNGSCGLFARPEPRL